MKKIKKVLAFFLALAMMISVLPITGVQIQAAVAGNELKGKVAKETATTDEKSTMVKFYYDNSKTNWSEVYAYVWGGDTTTTVKGTVTEKNIYTFSVSSDYQNVLFKNTAGTDNWDQQTADAGAPQSEKIFTPNNSYNRTDGSWKTYTAPTPTPTPSSEPVTSISIHYDNSKTKWANVYVYAWVEGDSSVTPVVIASSAHSGDKYSFNVSNTYKNVLFKNTAGTDNWDQQTADTTLPSQSGYTFVTNSGANRTEGNWEIPATNKTVYYDNSKTNWSNVYAYVWVEGNSSVTPEVLEATAISNNVYAFDVAGTYKNILFKNTPGTTNWDQQTADADIPAGSGYTYVTDGGYNRTGGSWKENKTKRRALVLGETSTSAVPLLDVTSMVKTFENFTFDGKAMDHIVQYNDHTISNITTKIQTMFADTTQDDVSYIYMTSHGSMSGYIYIGSDGYYSGSQLRNILDRYVKGQVVLMIDCCYAGASIDKEEEGNTEFAEAFLKDFLSEDVGVNSGELASSRFHVLCSSSKSETSYGGTTSLATRYWEKGCGWLEQSSVSTSLMADANADARVTMNELYTYAYPLIVSESSSEQHIVVYPENDSMVIGGRY